MYSLVLSMHFMKWLIRFSDFTFKKTFLCASDTFIMYLIVIFNDTLIKHSAIVNLQVLLIVTTNNLSLFWSNIMYSNKILNGSCLSVFTHSNAIFFFFLICYAIIRYLRNYFTLWDTIILSISYSIISALIYLSIYTHFKCLQFYPSSNCAETLQIGLQSSWSTI